MMKSDHTLSEAKFQAQLRLLDAAARSVFAGVFGAKQPPDKVLAEFFRTHRQCGSRDRQTINLALYALLRCWGWLRHLPEEPLRQELEHGTVTLSHRELGVLLYAALRIDAPGAETGERLGSALGMHAGVTGRTALERAGEMLAALDSPHRVGVSDLWPEWVDRELAPDFPRDRVLERLAVRPPLWLRVRPKFRDRVAAELAALGAQFEEHPRLGCAWKITGARLNLAAMTAFQEGCFEVQDLASQGIGAVAASSRGERWLDACAGAGGKTLQLAEAMNNTGSITAGDVRAGVLEKLRQRARRAGYSDIAARPHDGGAWKGRHPYDGVLLDVPCSGSGVWRRNPLLQWVLEPAEPALYAARQRTILENFAPAVRVGGRLIYSTCSMFDCENRANVQRFLGDHPEFELEEFRHPLSGVPVPGMVQFTSADGDCDTMFAARMIRKR